jgi:hypothetical protein
MSFRLHKKKHTINHDNKIVVLNINKNSNQPLIGKLERTVQSV